MAASCPSATPKQCFRRRLRGSLGTKLGFQPANFRAQQFYPLREFVLRQKRQVLPDLVRLRLFCGLIVKDRHGWSPLPGWNSLPDLAISIHRAAYIGPFQGSKSIPLIERETDWTEHGEQ